MSATRRPLNSHRSDDTDFERLRSATKFYIGVAVFSLMLTFTGLAPGSMTQQCIMIAGAIAALKRRLSGYYLTYFFSVMMLPVMPLGTVVGWVTIKNLRRNRSLFLRW